jgi:hypothetical protein
MSFLPSLVEIGIAPKILSLKATLGLLTLSKKVVYEVEVALAFPLVLNGLS